MTTDQIAAKIVKEHAQFKNELRHAVIRARRIGDLLIEAKLNIPHGEWMKWVDDKAKLSLTWASTYMAIASGWERVEKYGVDISVRQAEDVARGRPIKEHGGHNDAAIGRLLSILEVKVADLVLDYPEISDIVDEIHKWRERLAAIGQLKKARGAKSTRPDITEKVMNAYVAGYRPIQIFKELQKQGAHVSYGWVQKVCSGKIGKRVASAVAIAFLMLSSSAFAELPVASITGPDKGRPGDIIILTASCADHVDWLVDSSSVAVPVEDAAASLAATAEALRAAGFSVEAPANDAPPVYLELDGGKRLLLASYSGTYRVSLAVGNADGVDQCAWKVTVSGGIVPPKPDDPIPPIPDVEPKIPVGRFGLGIKAWRAAQLVKSADRPSEAKQLAAALLLSVTAADGQTMVDQFASTMKTKFSDTQKAAWEPWRAAYLAELKALQADGKLATKGDWVAAFSEMALGLAAVDK